jgi:hypothetical protein
MIARKHLVGAASVAVFVVSTAWAGEHKDYPVALKVLETDAISSKADGTRVTTSCTSTGPGDVTCDSRQVSTAQHTELVSFADASDGKLYMISCIQPAGARFAQGFAAGAGSATTSGCLVPPGTYKARWDEGRLRVLHEKNGKSKETTFVVLSSEPMPATPQRTGEDFNPGPATPARTLVLFSSTPPGAEIQMDGSFVGSTPSSIPVSPGEHSIRIRKSGYRPWERTVKTVGGEVTITAELEAEAQ